MTEYNVLYRGFRVFNFLFFFIGSCIPVYAFYQHNGWLCLGLLAYFLSSRLGHYVIPSLLIVAIGTWRQHGFVFHQQATFLFLCSVAGFHLFTIARGNLVLMERTKKKLVGAVNRQLTHFENLPA